MQGPPLPKKKIWCESQPHIEQNRTTSLMKNQIFHSRTSFPKPLSTFLFLLFIIIIYNLSFKSSN